ncbi:hypothetical protein ML401_39045 (plasmid) [Bradyrhizobium sp. 62B]|nr:hypothetical protein ML401_39045 [Bradyrhizobium sp. 62B]
MSQPSVIRLVPAHRLDAPLALKPSSTFGLARSGSTSPIGASSDSLPCSASCIAPAVVTAFVIDPIQNMPSMVTASGLNRSRLPNPA